MTHRKHRYIPKPKKEKDSINIPKPKLAGQSFRFVSIYPWLRETDELFRKYNFTNLCSNSDQFANLVTDLIEKTIPKVNQDYKSIFINASHQVSHCHKVDQDHLSIIRSISKKLHNDDFEHITDNSDYSWWQLGFTKSARIIGIFSQSQLTFYPIFVDWHHLIYSDEHHNQSDYNKFDYDPHHNYAV